MYDPSMQARQEHLRGDVRAGALPQELPEGDRREDLQVRLTFYTT